MTEDKKVKRTMEIWTSTQATLTDMASDPEHRQEYRGCYQPLARDILKNFCAVKSYALAAKATALGIDGLVLAKGVEALREAVAIIESDLGQSGDTVKRLSAAADAIEAIFNKNLEAVNES